MRKSQNNLFSADGINKCNKIMLFSAASLLVIGIVFVFEADNLPISFGIKGVKQIIWAFFGVATTLLFTLIDYKKLADEKSLKRLMIILGILLFILAFCSILYLFGHDVKLGTYGLGARRINGAYRWIDLGFFSFQPSTFTKIVLILFTCAKLSQIPDEKKKNPKKNNKDSEQSISNSNIYKQILGFSGLFFFLIIVQPSTSVALSFAVVVFAILMLKNAKFVFGKGFLIFSAIFVLTATIALNGFPHIRERLTKGGDNYQSQQAITAIGSGGIFGLGLGKSEAKFNRLPEIENDYIFSLIAEETGITGSLFFMIIYILFITQGFFTAMNSQDNFGKLAAFGFTVNYAFAFLAHLFVNLGFISTGASLPFVSYGGTAMIADTISLGILLNISSSRYEKYERIRI